MFKFLTANFFLFLFSSQIFSQEYPVKIFTTNDGLSQMQVLTTFKDSRGFIWVGTKYGICKYNGEKFTRYKPIQNVLGSEVNEFIEDYSGNLYINSTERISRFDGKDFKAIKHVREVNESLTISPDNKLYAIINHKITKINEADSLIELNWPSLKNRKINRVYFEKGKKELLAIIDSIGLVEITENTLKVIFPSKEPNLELTYSATGQRIFKILSGDKETIYYQKADKQWVKFIEFNQKQLKITNSVPFDYPFVFQQNAYILVANTTNYQLINKDILSPHEENWITYVKNGFYMPSELGLIYVNTNGFKYFKKEDVPYCWSVSEDKFENKWIWNYGYPTTKWNGQKMVMVNGYLNAIQKSLDYNFKEDKRIAGDWWYFGSLKDKYGNLWQSHGNGILHFDYKKFNFFTSKPIQRSISFSILEDTTNNVILSGSYKSVDIYENKPPYKSTTLDAQNGLNVGTYVLSMALESAGIYWFGGGNMVSRYDSNKKTWKEFSKKNGKMNTRIFLDMCYDSHKTLWIASVENGLYYYNSKRDSMMIFPNDEFRDPINFVGEIDAEHLMVGGSHQIYVVDLKAWYTQNKVIIKTYNNHNGYMGMETGQHGFFRDSKGILWIASGTILSVIDPKKLNLNSDSLRTYFTKFNRVDLPFNYTNQTYSSKGDVRAEFESVGENKSVESQYAYKLDGAEEWSPWQNEPVVTFSKLASGNYTLCVKSRTGNGDDSFTTPSTIRFSVSVPIWESPNFPLYALATLMAAIWLFYYSNNRQIRKDRKAQLEITNQQQLLLQKELDYKSQTLQVQALQVQTAQAQMNPHFTFNVLNTLQHLINGNDTESANLNLLKLSKLMRSYLDASISSEIDPKSPEKSMITLDKEIELLQMYVDFEQLKYENRFEVNLNVAPEIGTDFYRIPPLIIQPFVENAIVHGVIPNENVFGKITVNFKLDDDENLICEIIDNGLGRQEAQKRKEAQITAHLSHGTELVEKRVKILNELGYKINIQTTDNEPSGTIVTIIIITS
jgi:Histidine kinase